MPDGRRVLDASEVRSRSRIAYAMSVVALIALGLASRRYPNGTSILFGKYPGDALWAAMVFFGLGALRPHVRTLRLGLLALAVSFGIEFLKLYQAPWIVDLRHTTAGHLVFGHVFSIQNLVAYAVGIVIAVGVEWLWPYARRRKTVGATGTGKPPRPLD